MSPKVVPQLRQTRPLAGLGTTVVFGAVRVIRRLPPHLPRVGPSSRAGRNWHLPPANESRAAVAGASSGRFPLPLWMSGTPSTLPSRRALVPRGHDVGVSTRIVYTDLDSTQEARRAGAGGRV